MNNRINSKRRLVLGLLTVFGVADGGCDVLIEIVPPEVVTVTLVNEGNFPVDVRLFYSDEQLILEDLITEVGTELDFLILAGAVRTFTRNCDDLQAIIIDDADLVIVGEIGPEANTDVLRDGDDFGCGDRIRFTFDHSLIFLDFDVTVDVSDGS